STEGRTDEFGKMFPGFGIKDANACLYWVKQLVEISTNDVSANDQTNTRSTNPTQGDSPCHFPLTSPPAPGPSTRRTARSASPSATLASARSAVSSPTPRQPWTSPR